MPIIETKDLTHIYLAGTPYEKKALDRVSLVIEPGESVGIVGANGSGKSTLVQHFNGLLTPTSGSIMVGGEDTRINRTRKELWKKVGLVFQFPEEQLFKSTVFDEMAFGLENLGLNTQEIKTRVEDTLIQVGLDPSQVAHLPPARLSGGARRLVAIGCVLAMRPPVLVLDEPTAGLDPSGCNYILKAIKKTQQLYNTTVVMISHYVDELVLIADKLVFLEQGRLIACGKKEEVLRGQAHGMADLLLPDHLRLIKRLANCGYQVDTGITSIEGAALEIDRVLKELAP
ncbi:MAG: ATP-binding cassette domain-containing protein [Syntrophomonadaceae bacterium]|jgi:energy-coupling factor transport system ATP-binding protein